MFRSRAAPLAKQFASAQRQVLSKRGYASPAAGGGGNMPLVLGLAGLAGLGGYVYLQRNPSTQAAISANKNEAAGRAEDAADSLKSKAQAGAAALSANANEAIDRTKDQAQQVKEEVKGPFDEERKAIGNPGAAPVEALVKNSWVDFKLEKIEPYNHNTKIYTFSFPDSESVAGGKVASALLTKASDPQALLDDKGKPVIRPYTPISHHNDKGYLKLLVKEYPTGKMSKHIANLKPGETLAFKGPIIKYEYKPNEFSHGVAIGGGSGITPMFQMISHSLNLPEDKTKWTLIFANVTEKDILLREEWDKLAKQHPDRFKAVYTLDNPPFLLWKGEKGFVTKEMISKYLPSDHNEKANTKFFVCGPPGQYAAVCGPKDGMKQGEIKGALGELGYGNENVFKF